MKYLSTFLLLGLFIGAMPVAAQEWRAPLEWHTFDQGLSAAAEAEKKILIDIYAPWCGWCKRLHEEVYTDERVQSYLKEHFTLTHLNVDGRADTVHYKTYTLAESDLAGGFGAQGTPTTVFLGANSDYITRLPGFMDADGFLDVLQFIASDAYQSQSFQEWQAAETAGNR